MDRPVLYLVTSNEGKWREIRRELEDVAEVRWLRRGYPEIQSGELREVLAFGLPHLFRELLEEGHPPVPLFADDSGLFIDALGGFPGVYSSYVEKTIGLKGILKLMEGVEERGAEFRCVIGLLLPLEGGEYRMEFFEGHARGVISAEERGYDGFGYDPIFVPLQNNPGGLTFAQMSTEEKNRRSHRGEAIRKMKKYIIAGFHKPLSAHVRQNLNTAPVMKREEEKQ